MEVCRTQGDSWPKSCLRGSVPENLTISIEEYFLREDSKGVFVKDEWKLLIWQDMTGMVIAAYGPSDMQLSHLSA